MRSDDNYRAMMDLIDIKLNDQDSMFQKFRLSLSNSALFTFNRLNPFTSEIECKGDLEKCANDSVVDRRRKLDHEICLLLEQRFHLAPGNFRKQFDDCWSKCFSNSFQKHTDKQTFSESVSVGDVLVGVNISNVVYNAQLMSIVSEAWGEYLKGVRCIIDKAWKEGKRD